MSTKKTLIAWVSGGESMSGEAEKCRYVIPLDAVNQNNMLKC